MCSADSLREFVSGRLSAAAEEILTVFKNTVAEYEEEIERQRRLLELVWKPEIQLHRLELPQQHVCKEEQVLADQQLWIQESLDQEDPQPPQVKEEQEELWTSPEGEQLGLKQETDAFMLTPAHEEREHSEAELNSDHQLLSHDCHVAESQDQRGGEREDSGSTRDAEPKQKKQDNNRRSPRNKSAMSKVHHDPHTASRRWWRCGRVLHRNFSARHCGTTWRPCVRLCPGSGVESGSPPAGPPGSGSARTPAAPPPRTGPDPASLPPSTCSRSSGGRRRAPRPAAEAPPPVSGRASPRCCAGPR
ncbi:28S ribosomal protein S28, mitochondrial isoform X3 [Micropterus salmoides]|uniref:28S ribosomal protein S28, mitochondrial isoform X3 n=1 Tax=Micropterus salmoides TaxID=27706 RepID=UPI0018EBE42A|nr:28S ribosomal protein S28, mitochondrial isoform X3 [Micropterus salmoides]